MLINSWFWDFGDGTTSTEQNPTHMFPAPGSYPVILTVGDAEGNTSTTPSTPIVVTDSTTGNPETEGESNGNSGYGGEPISTATGELYFSATDLFLGGPLPLSFGRYYASLLMNDENVESALGTNWMHSFDLRLVLDTKNYTSKKNNIYRKGEPIYITAQIFGHKLKKVGDSYHINITTDFLVLDDAGKILGGQKEVLKFNDISPIPVTDFSLDLTYTLTGAPAGIYKFQTTVNDKNSAKSTQFDTKIEIR